jgi:osmotically-inducible protein OsmY
MSTRSRLTYPKIKVFAPTMVLAFAMLTSGCSGQAQAGDKTLAPTSISAESLQTVNEQWTAGLVEGALLFNPHLNNFKIDVEAEGDTVTLSGTVKTEAERALAEQIALSLDSVEKVTNQITIAKELLAVESEGEGLKGVISDATITTRVKTRLLANGQTTGLAIKVNTEAGNVVLSGHVDSGTERDLAYYVAKNTRGVVNVDNQITIVENPQAAVD